MFALWRKIRWSFEFSDCQPLHHSLSEASVLWIGILTWSGGFCGPLTNSTHLFTSFLQFHTSFVKQVWISITTSVWCIWRADQPHWAHLSAPWLLLRRSRTLPSMTSRNVLQGVAAGFDFFFLAADCHTEKRSGKTSRNMARHRTHGCCRNQEGDSGVACSLELNLSCNELRWRISNWILIRGPTQSRCTGFY